MARVEGGTDTRPGEGAGRREAGRTTAGSGSGYGIEPIGQIVPVALILLAMLLAFAAYVVWREAVEPALCGRAEDRVDASHPELFEALRSSAHMTMRCIPSGSVTSERVEVRWDAVGGAFLATYEAPLVGAPRADDVGARSIEKVAPFGPRALTSLTGR